MDIFWNHTLLSKAVRIKNINSTSNIYDFFKQYQLQQMTNNS